MKTRAILLALCCACGGQRAAPIAAGESAGQAPAGAATGEPSSSPPRYILTEVPARGDSSWAVAINERGQMAGNSGGPPWTAWRYDPEREVVEELVPPNPTGAFASAIGDEGAVAGGTFENHRLQAYLTGRNGVEPIGQGQQLLVSGLGPKGAVVGTMLGANDQAVRVEHGAVSPLPVTSSGSFATATNRRGDVVGSAYVNDGSPDFGDPNELMRAFLVHNGAVVQLGTLGARSWPKAINDAGQIVGDSTVVTGGYRLSGAAFIYEAGKMRALSGCPIQGEVAFEANAIDSHGHVLGTCVMPASRTPPYPQQHPFVVWSATLFSLQDLLDAPGWVLDQAVGINAAHQIAATAISPDGSTRAVLLLPQH